MKTNSTLVERVAAGAALALMLVSAQANAGKKVAVQFQSRSGQTDGVAGWSNGLVAAATNAVAPLPNGAPVERWIGINFSKHHILPQNYLQALAGLAISPDAGNDKLRTRLVNAIRAIATGPAGGPPKSWNLGPIEWSSVNLFEGPTSFYRSDDPGEKPEDNKPRSFDADRWQKLQAVRAALENASDAITLTEYVSSTDNLNKQQKGGKTGFEMIVEAVEALPTNAGVHPFSATDWVDNANDTMDVADLIVYNNNEIQVAISKSMANAYQLKPR